MSPGLSPSPTRRPRTCRPPKPSLATPLRCRAGGHVSTTTTSHGWIHSRRMDGYNGRAIAIFPRHFCHGRGVRSGVVVDVPMQRCEPGARRSTSPRRRWPRRMHASGEPVTTIAGTLGVSRATVYRVPAGEAASSDTSP